MTERLPLTGGIRLTNVTVEDASVRLQLTVRKVLCRHPTCGRRIFTERLPDFVTAYARKTSRLVAVLSAIGVALGGNVGSQLAARLQLPTSPSTLLHLVRRAPIPSVPGLQAVGVDEWAWRRGHRYGTILVDLVMHRVVDLPQLGRERRGRAGAASDDHRGLS